MQKIKGLWIPADILLDENLTDKEKIILSMILYLSDETGSSFASNGYLSGIVKVSTNRVSKIISSLNNKGYIQVKLKYKNESKEIEQRQIIPIVQINNRCGQKSQEGIGENNNTDSYNGQVPIGESNKDIINNIKNKKIYNKTTNKYIPYRSDRNFDDFNWDSLYAN